MTALPTRALRPKASTYARFAGRILRTVCVFGLTLPVLPAAAAESEPALGGPSVVRGPYLQLATSESVTVRWRTDVATPTRLDYGTAPGELIWVEEDPTPVTDHVVRLSGLTSDTKYYYAVVHDGTVLAGDDPDHFLVTAPVPGTPKPMRIWVLGDSGTGDANAAAVRDAYDAFPGSNATDLWLMLGDNAYPHGTDEQYQTGLFEMYPEMLRRAVLWPTLGNHDTQSSDPLTESGPYFDMFTLPADGEAGGVGSATEAYYSFDYANVHFVVLDSQISDRSLGSPMLTWLETDLVSTAQDWIVAYWHHPPYSKGTHDSDLEFRLVEMRENVVPILEDYGVDLVLTGHSHNYERSFLIDGHYGTSDELAGTMILDGGDGGADGDGPYWKPNLGPDPHRGAVYTVAGCSGKTTPGPLDHPAMHVSVLTLGSVVLDFDGGRLDATFLDSTGQVRDSFAIAKDCPDSDRTFSSLNGATGNESFVFTPGLCDAGPPCSSDISSSVSSSLMGSFWLPGNGNPLEGSGTDNGAAAPLEPGNSGWVKTDAGSAAYIEGNWSNGGVDGCIGLENATDCMALTLADQADAKGYFALLTAAADEGGNYFFDRPADEAIDLAAIPNPVITGSTLINQYTTEVDLHVNTPTAGVLLDHPGCTDNPLVGYRIYRLDTGRIDPAPVDRRIASGWAVAQGGELPSGDPIPFGTPTTVTLICYTAINAYLGTALVFQDGFELPLVSETPFYILCSNCATDDDQDGACGVFITGVPGADCDDTNGDVHPNGEQICGDGLNNDCLHPSWPDLVGTNEFDDDGDGVTECQGDCADASLEIWGSPTEARLVLFLDDKQTLDWEPPVANGGGTLTYELLRALEASDFDAGAECVTTGLQQSRAIDEELPPVSSVFYYLVRPANECGGGSLGFTSGGVERTALECP